MRIFPVFICVMVLLACTKEEDLNQGSGSALNESPDYFPDIEFPKDNEFSYKRWELGKKLFFDPILSVDSTLSCGSCHKPEFAFANNERTSSGVENRPGTRNVPSLSNVAFHPYYTREGGVPTLEMQVLVPIQEHNEFDFNIVDLGERLKRIPEYVELSEEAYNREPDHFVITRAISCFERSLISGRSKYDAFRTFGANSFTEEEILGMDLFFSERLSCGNCHEGFDFTNYAFENNGLYETYLDVGRYRFTKNENDKFLFKTPSLRNVSATAPYMHDGSLPTLEDVIEHYDKGGCENPQKNKLIKPLGLTMDEKHQLLAFLKSLEDQQFITNQKFYEN